MRSISRAHTYQYRLGFIFKLGCASLQIMVVYIRAWQFMLVQEKVCGSKRRCVQEQSLLDPPPVCSCRSCWEECLSSSHCCQARGALL